MRRWLAALAAAGLLLMGASPVFAEERLPVQLVQVSPQWISTTAPVFLTLRVESETDRGSVSVVVRRSEDPLRGRSEVALSRKGKSNLPMQSVGVFTFPSLPVGGAEFPLVLPTRAFADARAGAYALEVEVVAGDATGRTEVLLPVLPDGALTRPLQLVTLWPLTASPTLLAGGGFTSETAVDQFGITGSTQAVLQAGKGRSGLTWLLDPATVAAAQRIAAGGGYELPAPADVSAAQAEAAAIWLGDLTTQIATTGYYQLPYANADVNGLRAKRFGNLLAAALGIGPMTPLPTPPNATALLPSRGDYGPRTWEWVQTKSPGLVVVSDQSYPSLTSVYTPSGVAMSPIGRTVLVADSQMASEFTNSLISGTAVRARQALLADLLVTALEQPAVERVMVLQPRTVARGITVAAATATLDALDVPWVNPVSAAAALSSPAAVERAREVRGITPLFNSQTLRTFWDIERGRKQLRPLIGGTIHDAEQVGAELQLTSNLYLSTAERQLQREAAVRHMVELASAVRIVSAGSVVFAGERGVIPITVRNGLSVPVTVSISAIGEPVVRVAVESVAGLTIDPGKRKSIELDTTFRGSDLAHVRLQVLTTNGDPVGEAVRIQIYSSAYSKAAAWVVYGAFGVLLLLVAVNTVRRVRVRRHQRKQAARG